MELLSFGNGAARIDRNGFARRAFLPGRICLRPGNFCRTGKFLPGASAGKKNGAENPRRFVPRSRNASYLNSDRTI
jgi:hypothetical protein